MTPESLKKRTFFLLFSRESYLPLGIRLNKTEVWQKEDIRPISFSQIIINFSPSTGSQTNFIWYKKFSFCLIGPSPQLKQQLQIQNMSIVNQNCVSFGHILVQSYLKKGQACQQFVTNKYLKTQFSQRVSIIKFNTFS